jgi:hypothetical protein
MRDWLYLWILGGLALPKLVLTVLNKREILQWKKRIFKRSSNLINTFWENSSKTLQIVIKSFVWFFSIIMILSIIIGLLFIAQTKKEIDAVNKLNKGVSELFIKLNDIPDLSSRDRIFINKKRQELFWGGNVKITMFNKSTYNSLDSKAQYAYSQYSLGHPEEFLEAIEKPESEIYYYYPEMTINAAFELGLFDDCRRLIEHHKKWLETTQGRSINDISSRLIQTIEKVGLFELAKEIIDKRATTSNSNKETIPVPSKGEDFVWAMYQAHALLMTGESEKALAIYRRLMNDSGNNSPQQNHDWKEEIKKDFAVFRWLGFVDTDISRIEKELHLNRLHVYSAPADDSNTSLAQPFIGAWQYEDDGHRVQWEIKDKYNLCHYLFQSKKNEKWEDDDIAATRYRFKQVDDKLIIEELNVRENRLSVSEIVQVTADEFQAKTIDNGNGADHKIRVFQKMKK